ncbi:MAG: hypothetical protein LUD51_03925 [Clostridia bacterium]|nr:hypothetical protein [Clostridia bacterium]
MTKTRKTATILAAVLLTAALAATAFAFAGCTDNGKETPGDTTTPTEPVAPVDPAEPAAAVVYDTSIPTDMGAVSFTFYEDGKVDCQSGYTPINGKVDWKYANDAKTQITFIWGQGNPEWTLDIVSVGEEQVAMYIESESQLLPGPYVGFLTGITGAYISSNQLSGKDVIIILRDDGTTSVTSFLGTSSTTWKTEKTDVGNIITITTDDAPQTGTVKYDGGIIVSMHFDSFFGSANDFTPLTSSVA